MVMSVRGGITLEDMRDLSSLDQGHRNKAYGKLSGALQSYFSVVTGDPSLADDLAQEVTVKVYEKGGFPEYDEGRAHPSALLTQFARNHFIDSLRRRRARGGNLVSLSLFDDGGEPVLDTQTPDTYAPRREQSEALGEMLASAPPGEERDTLVAVYTLQRTHKETAEIIGIPVTRVKYIVRTFIARARENIDNGAPGYTALLHEATS